MMFSACLFARVVGRLTIEGKSGGSVIDLLRELSGVPILVYSVVRGW